MDIWRHFLKLKLFFINSFAEMMQNIHIPSYVYVIIVLLYFDIPRNFLLLKDNTKWNMKKS